MWAADALLQTKTQNQLRSLISDLGPGGLKVRENPELEVIKGYFEDNSAPFASRTSAFLTQTITLNRLQGQSHYG